MLDILLRTLDFAAPVLATIFTGLFLAGFLLEMGWVDRMAALARPLVAVAHLPPVSAPAFMMSLGSAVAANGMIGRFHKEGLLSDRETLLCSVMNSIPVYLREIFTYQLPIVIPALGFVVGGAYGLVFLVTAFVKVSLVVLLGRLLLPSQVYRDETIGGLPKRAGTAAKAVQRALYGQLRLFFRISAVYLAMTFLVFNLQERGFFQAFSALPLARAFHFPPEAIVPLTSYVASPILGISLLGPMIHSGSISPPQALEVLMLGSMFMLPVFALRSMVPNYTAIFGMRLGLSVVAFSTGISVLVRLLFLLALLRLF
ncbi:MAG: Nucleoside recognition [Methanosaeta sp. PtaB.Bin039]|nr:MAG: Nucleoside recognition [Methanosaeta sp. PtaB.Bin039]OPY45292.1 MAG: Nucleoside recognition [Methanosaeta sp. PtaU1.Bin028]HOT06792.1 nucleoside recognition protein [Methanotrichaceae archaeon]HQF15990.1 nucleoside recognition protein [Methanotrichaceae archaeon]HQI90662.1 nucleoside recognition protein [Methanotrichaceae archaeon]